MINYKNITKEKTNLSLIVDNDILIRIITRKDVSLKYLNWLKSYEIMKFTDQSKKNHTLKSTRAFVEEKLFSNYDLLFGIFIKNEHIGNTKLGPINWKKKEAQVSFFLGEKNFWGQGIMPKVINIILSYAFKSLKLMEIKAGYEKKNLASAKVFKKCNFEIIKTDHKPILNSNKIKTIIYVSKKVE